MTSMTPVKLKFKINHNLVDADPEIIVDTANRLLDLVGDGIGGGPENFDNDALYRKIMMVVNPKDFLFSTIGHWARIREIFDR